MLAISVGLSPAGRVHAPLCTSGVARLPQQRRGRVWRERATGRAPPLERGAQIPVRSTGRALAERRLIVMWNRAWACAASRRPPPPAARQPPPSALTAPPLPASTATGCNPQNPAFTLEQMGGLLPVTTGIQVAPRFTAVLD
jgi:hypothetical protein